MLTRIKSIVATTVDSLFPRLWMERELRSRPNHFEGELWLLPLFCDKQMTAIDIGANSGAYSYCMLKYSSKVIAFEPNKDLWQRLRRLLGAKVQLEDAALSDNAKTATLRVDRHNTGVATIEEKNSLICVEDHSEVASRTVNTRTLDSFDLSNISLIKIDVEGHEEAVIEGARETIARNRPVLIIESEDRHNPGAPGRLVATMAKVDYKAFYLRKTELMEFRTLTQEDLDPRNLQNGSRPYVNNFIFLPDEQLGRREQIRAYLSSK
jgi:FkbM family methyltransferase